MKEKIEKLQIWGWKVNLTLKELIGLLQWLKWSKKLNKKMKKKLRQKIRKKLKINNEKNIQNRKNRKRNRCIKLIKNYCENQIRDPDQIEDNENYFLIDIKLIDFFQEGKNPKNRLLKNFLYPIEKHFTDKELIKIIKKIASDLNKEHSTLDIEYYNWLKNWQDNYNYSKKCCVWIRIKKNKTLKDS